MDGVANTLSESHINTRRVKLSVLIGGHDATSAIEPSLLDFQFTDHAGGKADEIRLTLHDREGKWNGPWRPSKGTAVTARITALDWEEPGRHLTLPCGTFKVDEVEFSGPPDKVTLKAVTSALTSGLRDEAKTRAWENFSLQGLAGQIASENGLTLMYDGPEHAFGRQDQREESDLGFVQRLAKERGMNCKVHDGRLVLFDGAGADARPAALTIAKRGGMYSPASYSFKESSSKTDYSKAEVAYTDPAAGTTHTAEVTVPDAARDGGGSRSASAAGTALPASESESRAGGAGERGSEDAKTLQLNTRVESVAEAMRLGKSGLRDANKGKEKANLEIMGNPAVVAGTVLALTGFGTFDGRWFVEKAEHKIGGKGYTTAVEIRKTLAY